MSLMLPPGPSVLDVLYPYAGPCAFCGHYDKRHRMADAIVENVRAGDSVEMVAEGYDLSEEAVRALIERWDDKGLCDRQMGAV
jgi:hypothetical protein